MVTELFREVIPALERIVVLSQLYQDARNAPMAGIRESLTEVEGKLSQALEVAGEQMDMLVDRHMRDTMRTKRLHAAKGKGRPPGGVAAKVSAARPRTPGKRLQRAVKRSGRAKRGG